MHERVALIGGQLDIDPAAADHGARDDTGSD